MFPSCTESLSMYESEQVAKKCMTTENCATSCGHFTAGGGPPAPPAPAPGPALPPGIRYHALMEGVQEHPNNGNTCCEGQGTRMFGSMPEYLPPSNK